MTTENTDKLRFSKLWRNKFLCIDAKDFDSFISTLSEAVERLKLMKADGIQLDEFGVADDYATLYTYDEKIANKWGLELDDFEDEDELDDPDEYLEEDISDEELDELEDDKLDDGEDDEDLEEVRA